eukprot:CAMPEP_0168314084 /NCGR_PEP_ID=MMETSP0210-20121227/6233_1 /TAXON_ID=40633 /ORGANISM="Condylostoma magnum, Strain COL2" /LENGTH=56 /DNA_ID=CAMNT_0008278579 /DNA_START=943 /DNA_END=1113 /DNA_ORIENTATION=-
MESLAILADPDSKVPEASFENYIPMFINAADSTGFGLDYRTNALTVLVRLAIKEYL